MNKQSIIIYDFEILFIILKEIKENLKFEIFNFKKDNEISKLDNSTYGNYLIVVKSLSNFINKDIEKKKLYLIENLPIKIDKFIENLEDLKKAIESEDGKKLEQIFTKTKKIRKDIVKAGQDVEKPDFGRKS